ncbi:MAG: type II secretion system F family protein [Bdellovibrionales bacterium]|nr:type II secretion system F family protein [Bdellovibrionales bacterium]
MREKDRLSALRQTSAPALTPESGKRPKERKGGSQKLRLNSKNGYPRKLLQAGFEIEPRKYLAICGSVSLLVGYLASYLGIIIALTLTAMLYYYLAIGLLDDRAERRKRKVVPQLAPFLDSLTSGLGTGLNLEAAIVQATASMPPGILRTELDKVAAAIEIGFPVRDALNVLRDRVTGKEVTSLVVSLSLFSSMGGYVLEPFKRLARKIREQQQVAERAARDLVMVKQAFYTVFLLALSVPVFLVIAQPSYLAQAFNDGLGKILLQVGQVLILMALVLFKRMTSIKI